MTFGRNIQNPYNLELYRFKVDMFFWDTASLQFSTAIYCYCLLSFQFSWSFSCNEALHLLPTTLKHIFAHDTHLRNLQVQVSCIKLWC